MIDLFISEVIHFYIFFFWFIIIVFISFIISNRNFIFINLINYFANPLENGYSFLMSFRIVFTDDAVVTFTFNPFISI